MTRSDRRELDLFLDIRDAERQGENYKNDYQINSTIEIEDNKKNESLHYDRQRDIVMVGHGDMSFYKR